MFGNSRKDREARGDKPRSAAPQLTRRGLLEDAGGTFLKIVFAKTVAEITGGIAYDSYVNGHESIPADLQPTSEVFAHTRRTIAGLGNSLMRGQGAGNTSIAHRVAKHVQAEHGISMTPVSGAKNGSTAKDLPVQYEQIKSKIPSGAQVDLHVWTGENELSEHPDVINALQSLAKNPLQPSLLLQYPRMRQQVKIQFENDLRESVSHILDASGATDLTLYGLAPIQYAPKIEQIDPNTGKVLVAISLEGDSLEAKFKRFMVADLVRLGTRAVVKTAQELRAERGIRVTVVNSAAAIQPQNFSNKDDHFDSEGAERVAQRRARLYRRGELQ